MSSEFSPQVLELLGQNNKETVKIEPINSGLIKKPDQKDPNYWTIAQDMALSVPQGIVNAVEEQGDFIDENIVPLGGLEFGDKDGKLKILYQNMFLLQNGKQKSILKKDNYQFFINQKLWQEI